MESSERSDRFRPIVDSVLAGYVAGICGVLVGHPLDSLKVHIQLKQVGNTGPDVGASPCSTKPAAGAKGCPTAASSALLSIPAKEVPASLAQHGAKTISTASDSTSTGASAAASKVSASTSRPTGRTLRSLYGGIQGPLFSVGLIQAVNFGVYDSGLRYLHWMRQGGQGDNGNYLESGNLVNVAIASGTAGMTISFVTSPLQAVKIAQQIHGWSFRRALKKSWRMGGLYAGLAPNLICEGFGRMVYLTCYEALKKTIVEAKERLQEGEHLDDEFPSSASLGTNPLSVQERIVCAGISGMVSWVFIFPADVVRSRMYASALQQQRSGTRPEGMWQRTLSIYSEEQGLRPFYRGLGVTVLRAAPVAATVLPIYDAAHTWLSQRSFGGDIGC